MSDRRRPTLYALALGLSIAQLALMAVQLLLDLPKVGVLGFVNDVVGALTVLVFPAVGLLILRRYPAHLVGWLFVLTNLPWAVNAATGAWARYASTADLPGVSAAAWLYSWQGAIGFGLMLGLLFVFPTGSLPSRAWRPAAWLLAILTVGAALAAAFAPGPIDPTIGLTVENPLGLRGGAGDALVQLARWEFVPFMVPLVLGVAALTIRFARSRGLERQQLKWFVWAAAVFGALLLAGVLTSPLGDTSNAFWAIDLVILPLIPIAAGFAILRYRLYDIDLVINRTLVYGSLTALLALVYATSVLVLQVVASPLTGSSSLAVAASTLLVAALFQPARRRLQAAVDRRFYRSRYDAAREIAGFGARLRDEVEQARLAATIASTIERTVQPAFTSIWIREGADR